MGSNLNGQALRECNGLSTFLYTKDKNHFSTGDGISSPEHELPSSKSLSGDKVGPFLWY